MMDADALYPPRLDLTALSSLPLFTHVPHDLLTPIVEDENAIRYYHDGEIILHQGDPAENLLILLHGQARVVVDGIFLVARTPHDMLGELAFINHTTRNATVVAQGTVQTLVLRASLVERLMANTLSGKERYVKIGGEESSKTGGSHAHQVSTGDPRE